MQCKPNRAAARCAGTSIILGRPCFILASILAIISFLIFSDEEYCAFSLARDHDSGPGPGHDRLKATTLNAASSLPPLRHSSTVVFWWALDPGWMRILPSSPASSSKVESPPNFDAYKGHLWTRLSPSLPAASKMSTIYMVLSSYKQVVIHLFLTT